ncbi:MAG: pantoate--beta-alanine ligase [Coprococcus sp.]
MELIKTIEEVKKYVRAWKKAGLTIGLVPTMGYLHEGHQSLINRAVAENDRVIVSDFVNPIQFGPKEDLASYPRDIEADCALCEAAGAAIVFHPEVSEMYAENFTSFVDTTGVTEELCGKSRPIHFRGVCTVVNKLFNIAEPDRAYFGEKDAQQLAVIRRMVRDLNMNVTIIGCPIVREADGLAKSSRNTYLSAEERKAALVLSRAVFAGKAMIESGEQDGEKVLEKMKAIIKAEPLARIDYVEMVKWDTIDIHHVVDGPILVAMAVYIGKTRLIDNFIWEQTK